MEPKSAARYESLSEKTSPHALGGGVCPAKWAIPGRGTLLGTLLAIGITGAMIGACGPQELEGDSGSTGSTGVGGSGGGGGGGGGEGGGGPPPPTPLELFLKVEPELKANCNICHRENGSADAPFLAGSSPEERYASITAWPGIVTASVTDSILLTHPDQPTHGGGEAPPLPMGIKAGVIEWLQSESANAPGAIDEIGPAVKPFRPIVGGAFNTVYLGDLGPEFEYASISFNAKAIGGTIDAPTMLWLTNITVHTVADQPIHVVHPLFTVYAPGEPANPDPVDSFSNIDQTFTIDGDPTLGTGQIILTNWKKGSYLGLAFELIEVYGGNAGGAGGCKDIATFMTNVVPAMQTCMSKCHGGTDPQAKGTMNLSQLNAMTPTSACIEVRARIKPGQPDQSQIVLVTDPTQIVVHKYKFDGNLNQYNAFKDAVTPWILAEQ
jgi:hypothetical protein